MFVFLASVGLIFLIGVWMFWRQEDCTCEVGLGAAGFVGGAAEGPGGAGVTVLRLRAPATQTPHLTVGPIHHLYELSHPEDEQGKRTKKDRTENK